MTLKLEQRSWFDGMTTMLRTDQALLASTRKAINRGIELLELEVLGVFDEMWKSAFGEVSAKRLFNGRSGARAESWRPVVFLYDVEEKHLTDQGYWIEPRYDGIQAYDFNVVKVPDPVDMTAFRNFLTAFENRTGVKIEISYTKILKNPCNLHSVDDVRALYGPEFEVLEHGEVWHKGWDIADYFVLGRYQGRFVARYSTDAHGAGMTIEARTRAEFEEFFGYLDLNDLSYVEEKWARRLQELRAIHERDGANGRSHCLYTRGSRQELGLDRSSPGRYYGDYGRT